MNLQLIKKGLWEFKEQANIVQKLYGGGILAILASMIWCLLRYGARPIDYARFEFYRKSSKERNRYLTFYRYRRLLRKFGYYNENTHGKIAEYQTFKNYIHRDWIIADKNTDPDSIRKFILTHKTCFAKPNMGEQGHGVIKLNAKDSDAVNNLISSCNTVSYVVEEQIHNIDEIAQFNPSSLNSIRAFTLLQKDGRTRILSIMLRVGKKGSHVDNWGSGGIAYNIDVETGVCIDYGRDKKNNPYIYHPDTNIQMIGYKLPRYKELKEYIYELSKIVNEARYVGWDIAITPKGFDLIEMNCPGGHDILQAFGEPFGDILTKELS